MNLSYRTPGIYVEEVSTGAKPIEALGTSTAGFVGRAPREDAQLHTAVAIENWSQFVRVFADEKSKSTPLSHAVHGFFLNGGRRCFVVNVGADGSVAGSGARGQKKGLDVLADIDEVAIVAIPGFADAKSYDAALEHCERLKDRVAVLDAIEGVSDTRMLQQVATEPSPDTPDGGEPAPKGLRPRTSDGGYGAFYFPYLTVADPFDPKKVVNVPPCGHIAGIYSRVDATRGVHKAPANELVRGAINVAYRVSHEEQGDLNQAGVNIIRFFGNDGIRVWGARTLAPGSSEWRYLNMRRTFCMVEEAIGRGTRWVVFEPNDRPLWSSIKRDIRAFLLLLWRAGALVGRTPEEAFFVKCDEETNPPEVVDAGQVVVLIGLAVVKPAEFVIFRIGQHATGTEKAEVSNA